MTFPALAPLPVPGAAIIMEASTDNFATVLTVDGVVQRWSTVTGSFTVPILGSPLHAFDGRIASVGRHQRSLSADGLMAASTLSLVLDNTDGTFDWMTKPDTVTSTLLKARFRVALSLFDPSNPTFEGGRLLGIFTCLDFPTRDEARVYLELADDSLAAADIATPPTLLDWALATGTPEANTVVANFGNSSGIYPGVEAVWGTDPRRPLPLAFGGRPIPLLPTVKRWVGGMSTFDVQCVACCTTLLNFPGPPDAALWSLIPKDNGVAVPSLPLVGIQLDISRSIVKGGKTWHIWVVTFRIDLMRSQPWVMDEVLKGQFGAVGTRPANEVAWGDFWEAFWAGCGGGLSIIASPLSSHTYPAFNATEAGVSTAVTCADIARDLIQQYSRGTMTVDAASFDDVSQAHPSRGAAYVGEIGLVTEAGFNTTVVTEAGQLRSVLRDLATSGQFDLSVLPDGRVRAIANTATFSQYVTATGVALTRLDEERIVADSLRVRTPSQGQRWAPYNRVYLETNGQRRGPFDHAANITAWGKPFTRVISAPNVDLRNVVDSPFVIGNLQGFELIEEQFALESRVRPVVSFRYGPEVLLLELGDFFQLSLTRGGASFPDTYTDAIWKVEKLDYVHDTGQVEVEAVWVSDILTEVPFLLDDETLLLRVSNSTGGNATVGDDDVVTLANPVVVSSGVAVGDILVLQDATEAATSFERNRGVRIVEVNSTTQFRVAEQVLTAGSVAVATWKIIRGHTTYPTAISDPANYAEGSRMYGKAANVKTAGVYSNSDTANRIR